MGTIITSMLFAFTPYGIPLALASMWYHYTEDETALKMDYIGIFILSLFIFSTIINLNFWLLFPISILGYWKNEWGIIIIILLSILLSSNWFALLLFVLGLTMRILAKKENYNYDLWHSGWHILSSIGFIQLLYPFI